LTIGLTLWLRADALATIPLLAVVILTALPGPRTLRAQAALLFLGGVAVMDAALGVFLSHVYGHLMLTRPGLGVLLGQGIEDYPNPWHFGPIPGNVFGEEAPQRALVLRHHLVWGTPAADGLLLHQALGFIMEKPVWFLGICLARLQSVVSLAATGTPPSWWTALGLFAAPGLWFLRRERFAVLAVAATWAGRVAPFSVLHVETRYVAILIPMYAVVVAAGIADTAEALARLLLARRSGERKLPVVAAPVVRGE
jgi:hypothetical protein